MQFLDHFVTFINHLLLKREHTVLFSIPYLLTVLLSNYLDGKGVCSGDSGGPLVVPKSNHDDTAVVIGISSFGENINYEDCGLSVFARVSAQLDWINAHLE